MGSFNFKEPPHYTEKTIQVIGHPSATILPLEELKGQTRKDIRELPFDKKMLKYQGKLPFPLSSIGLLRVRHPHSKKVIDGTCVLISPKILLTCAHNLYSYEQKIYYQDFDYFPSRNGPEERKITLEISHKTVKIHPNFHQYETSQHQHYDYAIIMLERNMDDDVYGCVEVAIDYKPKNQESVYLFGYPVQENNVKHEVSLYGSKGKVVKLMPNNLFYDMETGAGQSGGPVFVEDQGRWKIIGIHTISDPSGVYINTNVASTLNSWINHRASTLVIENGSKIFADKAPKLSKMIKNYQWESLIALTFNNCNLTSDSISQLNKMSWNLKIVILDYNKLDSICLHPSKFKQLQKLFLNSNVITRIDDQINGFSRLKLLSLKNNRIKKLEVKIMSKILKILLRKAWS